MGIIKPHIKTTEQLIKDIEAMENTVGEMPHGEIRTALEVEIRILKRLAERIKDNSEDLYDQILDFSMRAAV